MQCFYAAVEPNKIYDVDYLVDASDDQSDDAYNRTRELRTQKFIY